VRLQGDIRNLNNRINAINFASLLRHRDRSAPFRLSPPPLRLLILTASV
jgi:hypothetical protein